MYQTIQLSNGARILAERIPGARTAALGFFVGAGSRHERPRENGAAHFIEHMLFKGTHSRGGGALAREIDALGGQVNAYTTKEATCFYARCLDSHLDRAMDLLCDMLFDSRFDEADVELERGVILEEIGMYEDSPEDLCLERLSAAVYRGASLGRPILGKASTLEGMSGQWLQEYQHSHYVPGVMVAALAGNFTAQSLQTLQQRLSLLPPAPAPQSRPAVYHPAVTVRRKAIEQNHVALAFPALSFLDRRKYQLQLLSAILGGGVSSRLFQQLRERRGLCYTVYSYISDHAETGLLGIYTAVNRELEEQALEAVREQVLDLAEHGPGQEELERVREQARAGVIMGLEAVQARMSHMGSAAILYGEVKEADEIIACYQAVTREQLRTLAGELFRFSDASLSAVGRVRPGEAYRQALDAWRA